MIPEIISVLFAIRRVLYSGNMNLQDAELLQQYVKEGSEAAFEQLVRRHFDLVYSAALRQMAGDAELARDVAQNVFADLARKAKTLTGRPSLAGWLYTSTHFAAAKMVRGEQRRRAREQEAFSMQQITSTTEDSWEQLRPTIDRAMHELDENEREAILLRFFPQRELRAVGEALGVTEDAARKRVERALEKLRHILSRNGLTSSSVSLAACLIAHAVVPAPAGLAATISGAALAGATSTSLPVIFQAIAMNKTTVAVCSALVLAGALTPVLVQQRTIQRLRAENSAVRAELAALEASPPVNNRTVSQTDIDAAELERLRGEHGELLRLRGEVSTLRRQAADAAGRSPASASLIAQSGQDQPSPFATLPESEVPGRYRLIESGKDTHLLTLRPDGSFVTANGDVRPWAIARDALLIVWQSGAMRFTNIATTGVYVGTKNSNQILRLEKID
jgi:RNA polymerase sigma factor (sigma-70 family)